ncbi:class I SAM-dependent methyltransferase [Amycolatopsis cihanbeyliensis]|uniref:Ubiquinone/menaquinone biosynthesis C-methylase UbiE n=1 Tax=Amycolatopsis cihanbeyliensis TaxID=1128664 RepID=A0A542DI74_AMYCI|nr:methyltransferase domain-containing protein [Amycolatopsis cihanbeyliensis]TQJ02797.1 ubiquinone/menaquinone biosynthesis C-methylase UbiE [Amycolatopsis cihanbeyliensis]
MNAEAIGGVFSAAHQEFTGWSARLWRPLGEITTAVARPAPGERVLDACCGAGASAIPAALAVGPGGVVHGIDVAEGLLEHGRREATALGLDRLRFVNADVLDWRDDSPYDLVQCAYGVFFFPDMDAGGRRLAGLLRPGGRFVVTTWLRDGMARLVPIGVAAAAPERPELAEHLGGANPSERVDTAEKVRAWLSSLGLREIRVEQVQFTQPLHPDDAWPFFLSAAMRGFVEGLPPDAVDRVRARFERGLREAGIDTLDGSSLIGMGRLPG